MSLGMIKDKFKEKKLEGEVKIHKETHLRSLAKGFTWRIVATTTTITIAYIITGEVGNALKIGAIEFFGKLLIYYLHERAWQQVPLGTFRKVFYK